MIEDGFFGNYDINEWLTFTYAGEETPARSIQELTNYINDRILKKKFIEQNPDKDITFDVSILREYIDNTTINQADKIDPTVFKTGKAIIKDFNLNPFNLSGFFINKSQLMSHLYDCLQIDARQQKTVGESLQSSSKLAYDRLNQPLRRGQRKGLLKKTQRIEIYIFDEETMERKRIEEFFDLE
jgi:hypothetical protein